MIETQEKKIVEGISWQLRNDNYLLIVETVEDGYWSYIKRNNQIEWSNGIVGDFEKARGAAVVKFHEMRSHILEPGLMQIDPELLAFHPENKKIYKDSEEANATLREQIAKSGKVYRLVVSKTGVTVSGNRRLESVLRLNREAKQAGKEPPFPYIDIEVKVFEDEFEELDELVRQNQYRASKSNIEIFREFEIIEAIEKEKAKRRMLSGVKQDNKGKSEAERKSHNVAAKIINERNGGKKTSGQTYQHGVNAVHWMEALEEEGKTNYAGSIEKLLNEGKVTAVKEIQRLHDTSPELAERVASEKAKPEHITKTSVSTLAENLKVLAQEESSKSEASLIEQAIAAMNAVGSKPTDDYLTPGDIKVLLVEFLGEKDDDGVRRVGCDPFANLEKDSIPAKTAFNVIDNGLEQDWMGTVATNIPFSLAGKAVEAFDRNIRAGNTHEGIFIAQNGILHNKGTQHLLKSHKISICLCRGRIKFDPGSILIHQKPERAANKSSFDNDSIICYYGDRHAEFFELFQCMGEVTRLGINPSDFASSQFALPKWVRVNQELLETSWKGNDIKIFINDEGLFAILINGNDTLELFEEEQNAKAFAIGHILLENELTTEDFDNSVFQ